MIVDLQAQVKSLQEEIHLFKNGKKSKTSSTPPSQDIGRSNQKSLREPSSLKTGGQLGHEGSTLQMKEIADEIIEYRPSYCKACGQALLNKDASFISRKQEIILPPIIPHYVEHQSYSCSCENCDFITTAELPKHLHGNIQYGTQVSAWVAYLSVRQYISYERISELMKDCFNMPISQGTIDNMLKDITKKAQPVYEQIQQRVEQSIVLGGDETGVKINGKKGWLFTFQTPALTFLTVSFSRGFDTITNLFQNGFPVSVYVTDCLAAQLKTPAKAHQICLAHLLRELNNFIDALNCSWSGQMKVLLQSAINLKKQMHTNDFENENENVKLLESQLDILLQIDFENKHKKVRAFIKRLKKNRISIFTFLYYQKVPPDNNASERAIRNAKVKMKVSNQFKIFDGAQRFAVIRSVIDTTIKNSQNVLQALSQLAKFTTE